MKVVTDISQMSDERRPVVIAAGFFDGLHLGHRKVIKRTMERARKKHGRAWSLTFSRHPLEVLAPGSAPQLLTSNEHKARLLNLFGLDGVLLMPFNRATANRSPEDFVRLLYDTIPNLTEIVVGKGWRFGAEGKGTTKLLAKIGSELGFDVTAVSPVVRKGLVVSSTRIRGHIAKGHLEDARSMLGRPFSVLGAVKKGRTIGRRLGFPTANIGHECGVLPPAGVYAVHAVLDSPGIGGHKRGLRQNLIDGVLNLGVRPTYGGKKRQKPLVELHLLDFSRELYGKVIEVFFVEKIRNERKFDSESSLKARIGQDVVIARKILEKKSKDSLYRCYCPVL